VTFPLKNKIKAGRQWLMPAILATQEDCGSKAAWANSSQDPSSKKHNTKRTGGVAQGLGPEFKPQYRKKKKKKGKKKKRKPNFETWLCCIAQAGLQLVILLPQPSE
jgi:hypothetical protein